MSDKIFKHKIVVEAVDRPLKEMRDQLKAINDIFRKQTDQIKKTTEAIGNLANMYKKFEIGKLAVSGIGSAMSGVAGTFGKGIDLMKDFGDSAVDAMQFRERAVFSLGRSFGEGSKKLQEVIDLVNRPILDPNLLKAISGGYIGAGIMENMMSVGEMAEKKSKARQAEELKNMQIEKAREFLFKTNLSQQPTNVVLNFDLSNVKKEDAEHIAKTVADKVKESIDARSRSAKELRKSGGKS